MRGKTKESHYLITKLFATDYFYFYCKPLLFFTYFFPYQISKNGQFSTYEEFEYEKKMNDIREEKFGKYGNYASQGFGNIAFYKPCVTFQYFYNKLCLYQKEKNKFFCIREDGIQDIEDNIMKEDLKYILKDKKLLLKKNMFIPNGVKEILLLQLEKYENKYVLAELLYYIVSENHMLPDIDAERLKQHQKQFSDKKDEFRLNICMNLREKMDEDRKNLVEKLVHAKAIQMVCINGNSLLKKNEQNITLLEEIIEQKKKNNEKNLNLEIIIEKPESKAELDACKFKENFEHRYIVKKQLIQRTITFLEQISKKVAKRHIHVKMTEVVLPYAIMIVKFEEKEMDYMKIDLYSPYIIEKKERPSFYIFRNMQENLYQHFQNVFYNIWNDDVNSVFLIGEEND